MKRWLSLLILASVCLAVRPRLESAAAADPPPQKAEQDEDKPANEKKLDTAALAWIEATMSCIECHKHARAILVLEN